MNSTLIQLPHEIEFILFLIKMELQNRKFVREMEELGRKYPEDSTRLNPIILNLIGRDFNNCDILKFYNELIDKYSKEILDEDSLAKATFDVFMELKMK